MWRIWEIQPSEGKIKFCEVPAQYWLLMRMLWPSRERKETRLVSNRCPQTFLKNIERKIEFFFFLNTIMGAFEWFCWPYLCTALYNPQGPVQGPPAVWGMWIILSYISMLWSGLWCQWHFHLFTKELLEIYWYLQYSLFDSCNWWKSMTLWRRNFGKLTVWYRVQ